MSLHSLYIDDWKHDCDTELVMVSVLADDPLRSEYDDVEDVHARRGEVGENVVEGELSVVDFGLTWVIYAGTMQERYPGVGSIITDEEKRRYKVLSITDLIASTRYLCRCKEI